MVFKESSVSFNRLNEVLELNPVVLGNKKYELKDGSIEFEKVDFSYDGKRKILVKSTFALASGKTYAIIGKTGSGKSTIFDLIVGIYPADNGFVKVGGVEINHDTIQSIRSQVTFCYQMPYLVNDTIERNILLLNPTVDKARFEEVIDMTGVRSIINRLTNGLKSIIGDSGTQLSGGERKRIQLAQTLMRDSQIYMFDELTASLDHQTAVEIMGNIQRNLKDKTLIFIEHRLNMIENVEEI
jgi:ABC-type multidrug transport system fused ATPase/permease subunit